MTSSSGQKNCLHPVKYREAVIFPKEKLFDRVKRYKKL